MAIVDKDITVKWNVNNRDHYESLGYKFTEQNKELEINVMNLPKGSNIKVDVKCDFCEKIAKKSFAHIINYEKWFCSSKCKKDYNKDFLISEIYRFYNENGCYPNMQDMKVERGYPSYHQYKTTFGSWNKIFDELGIRSEEEKWFEQDIDTLKKMYENHPKEEIIDKLIKKYSWGHICNKARSLGLKRNKEIYKNNNKADYTRQDCIDAFWDFYKKNEVYPQSSDFKNNPDYPSLSPYERIWGSWKSFIGELNILGEDGWYKCDEQVLIETYSNTDYTHEEIIDKLMFKKSWGAIKVKASKLGLRRQGGVKSSFNDEFLLNELKRYYSKYRKVPTYNEFADDKGFPHPKVYAKRFISWNNALQLVGFEVNLINDYSKEKIEKEAFLFYQRHGRSPYYNELKYSHNLIKHYWSNWDDFLNCLGLPPNRKIHDLKTKEDGIEFLVSLHEKLNKVPTTEDASMNGVDKGWFAYNFGSFRNALLEANLINDSFLLSKDEIVNNSILELVNLAESLNRMPSVDEYEAHIYKLEKGFYITRRNLCEELGMTFIEVCEHYLTEFRNDFGKIGHYYLNKNGEVCRSNPEMLISNYLIDSSVDYQREVLYKDICNNISHKMKCDWLIIHNDTQHVIEYFGLYNPNDKSKMVKNYVNKTNYKIKMCEDNNINLICLYPTDVENDLQGVKEKLSPYIKFPIGV